MKYTTLNQSKKLLKLGLKASTADMVYNSDDRINFDKEPVLIPWESYTFKDYCLPCWSCEALIENLPLPLIKKTDVTGAIIWEVSTIIPEENILVKSDPALTLFSAAYDLTCKILEKSYQQEIFYS